MEYIKDKLGAVVLAFDNENLYYNTHELDKDSRLEECIGFAQLRLGGNGGLKLRTILEFQEELGIITDIDYVLNDIKQTTHILSEIIHEYEDSISSLNNRIVLLEMEGSGHASVWKDYLCLIVENDSLTIYSSRKGALTASEIIEYYGLGENEYWDQIQVNGEFIEQCFSQITSSQVFCDTVNAILTSDQWMMKPDEVDWKSIVEVLLSNTCTNQMGIELKLLINFNLN